MPPKGNPGEPAEQPPPQFHTQAKIPWTTLIITTGITTVTGYLFLEGIRTLHRSVRKRGEAVASSPNPPETEDLRPPGALPNGTFQLPLPDGSQPVDFSGPAHGGFGTPRLADVSTPIGRLQHNMHQYQSQMDARFSRIEHLLNQHYGAVG